MKLNHYRGFIDVYCAERRRAEAESLTDSSFHGEDGVLNYVNTMFDLFLVCVKIFEQFGQIRSYLR